MSKCFFCDDICIDDEDEEGTTGKSIGNKIICDGCLEQLKEALDNV